MVSIWYIYENAAHHMNEYHVELSMDDIAYILL